MKIRNIVSIHTPGAKQFLQDIEAMFARNVPLFVSFGTRHAYVTVAPTS